MRAKPTERQLDLLLRKFHARSAGPNPAPLSAEEEAEIAPLLDVSQEDQPPLHFDRQGQPITLWEWAVRSECDAYRRVAETHLPNGYVVSSVWIGLRPGCLFESAHWKGSGEVQVDTRHETEAEALEFHRQQVKRLARKP